MTPYVWAAVGCVAGCLHAALLLRMAHPITVRAPAWGLIRLVIVTLVLTAAAWSGYVLSAWGGWGGGFCLLLFRYLAVPTAQNRKPISNVARKSESVPS